MKHVPVVENVLKLNDEVAAMNRAELHAADVIAIDLIGAPGCGKTALLEATLRRLKDQLAIGVLVGDLATTRDGQRLNRWCEQVVQINTGRGCHLEAHQVRQAMGQIDLARLDLLIIENVGNLICPVGFDLGQDEKVGMFSVADGEDKPAKHPHLVHAASVLVLNKIDLLPHVSFDMEVFRADAERLNPQAQLIQTAATEDRIDDWVSWLTDRCAAGAASSPRT
jgi:hydrogenase nickel incorporation protein HypB